LTAAIHRVRLAPNQATAFQPIQDAGYHRRRHTPETRQFTRRRSPFLDAAQCRHLPQANALTGACFLHAPGYPLPE
jgi:hypothetical protein